MGFITVPGSTRDITGLALAGLVRGPTLGPQSLPWPALWFCNQIEVHYPWAAVGAFVPQRALLCGGVFAQSPVPVRGARPREAESTRSR